MEDGESGDEALQVALEGDELADQHDGRHVDPRLGQSTLVLRGHERGRVGQQVDVVAQRREGGLLERVGGDERGIGALGAMPVGEDAAALPVRGDGREGVQRGGRQRLRLPVERVVRLASVLAHVGAEHVEPSARLLARGEEGGEDLCGVGGRGGLEHTASLGVPKAHSGPRAVRVRSRRNPDAATDAGAAVFSPRASAAPPG